MPDYHENRDAPGRPIPASSSPQSPWRVGRKVGRTIYMQHGDEPSDGDPLIGVMDTREMAATAVEARNLARGDGMCLISIETLNTLGADLEAYRETCRSAQLLLEVDTEDREVLLEAISSALVALRVPGALSNASKDDATPEKAA